MRLRPINAERRGWSDYLRGADYDDNPYELGTQEADDWRQGHVDAAAYYEGDDDEDS